MLGQRLYRYVEDIAPLVAGMPMLGEWGSVDVCYDGDKLDRSSAINSDLKALSAAGYRARKVGPDVGVTIDLTNVGDAFCARFVK